MEVARRVLLELCYDGSAYSGWQIQLGQPNVQTIQGELQKALMRVTGEEGIEIVGSGRTDSGVHALYQTAAFTTTSSLPLPTISRALNAILPPDIRIWRASYVDLDFHPIHEVCRKRYRYLLSDYRPSFPFFRKNVWNVFRPLDVERMNAASKFLLGSHDMSSFQTQGSPRKSTVRTVYDVSIQRTNSSNAFLFPKATQIDESLATHPVVSSISLPDLIVFEIEANGFLYNMVRAIVGTLYLFGERHRGFENIEHMKEIIDSCDRNLAGPTAPAHGLYMVDVVYPSGRTNWNGDMR